MNPPPVEYDKELYQHIKEMRKDEQSYMMCDLDVLGEGAAGTTYSAYVKPRDKFPEQIVLKEQARNRFAVNEYEALSYLRDQMMSGALPGYYIFMYGCFTSGRQKYIILEKADMCMDDFMTEYNLSTKQYLYIFYHVAQAVSFLEARQFNHGDLWIENVMLKWQPNQEDIPVQDREFTVKLIDYDSAFKVSSQIKNPSLGGADKYRKKFIMGYDLNRFFDSLIYSYESYIEKKAEAKEKKIARALKQRKRGKNVHVPDINEPDSEDELFDAENIIYPQEIIDFMYQLGPSEPNVFDDCPDMAGKEVMRLIKEYADKIGCRFA